MNNIILQVCQQFITEVLDFFKEGKAVSLAGMEKGLKESGDKFLREVIKTYLEETDRQIAEDKAGRRQKGLVVERRNEERTVYTRFGALTYTRSYYYNKKKETYVHPVDQVVGLEAYERVSLAVSADLVGHAAEAAYGESSRHVTGGEVSRQTVMKKIRKAHGLKVAAPPKKKAVKVLHVDADEDHVALQDGSNTIVPIVTVHEGVKKLCKGRNRCENTHHVCSYGKAIEDLWLEVAEWIYNAYEVDGIEAIYIHGDGASWIKEGLEVLPKSKPVLDKYHLNKAIMNCTGGQPEQRNALRQALRDAERDKLKKIVRDMSRKAKNENELKRIKDFQQYVNNNWTGIEIQKKEECGGSSAEAHVSHVLSARMSSRPMAWSREGLKFMAELRAFHANGGIVAVEHLRAKKADSSFIKKAMKRAQKVFHGISSKTLDNLTAKNIGKVNPLFKILRSIQQGGLITH
ncbi:MAG: ISLre2 family transposase [Desulfocucumaceae bacterium]